MLRHILQKALQDGGIEYPLNRDQPHYLKQLTSKDFSQQAPLASPILTNMNPGREINCPVPKIQHGYKHALEIGKGLNDAHPETQALVGMTKPYNKMNGMTVASGLSEFINQPTSRKIVGTYRTMVEVNHYGNDETLFWVATHRTSGKDWKVNDVVAFFQLGQNQYEQLLLRQNVP